MTRFSTQALLLRSFEFGESDRIVHLLTPETGRLTAIAKGARRSVKRFAGNLDLFNHLRVQVDSRRRGGMARLEQASLLSCFLPLRVDTGRFALGCYLLELLDRLAPEGGARSDTQRLFDFALAALTQVEVAKPNSRLRVLLELRALAALGLRPELRHCVRCGREPGGPAPVAFHIPEGGVLCDSCATGVQDLLRIHLGTLRALEQGLHFDFARLDRLALGPASLAEAGRLLARFQRFHVGVDLRSEGFLNQVLASPTHTASA